VRSSLLLRPVPITQGNPDSSGRARLRATSMTPNSTYLYDCGALVVTEENRYPAPGDTSPVSISGCRATIVDDSSGNDDARRRCGQHYFGNEGMCLPRDCDVTQRGVNDHDMDGRNSMEGEHNKRDDFFAVESLC
jgi:hypothetical protein